MDVHHAAALQGTWFALASVAHPSVPLRSALFGALGLRANQHGRRLDRGASRADLDIML